jgi:hypothetical protein
MNSMKAIVFALLAVFCVAASPVHAADSRNVNVINETGYDIKMLGFNGPDDGLDEWDNELTRTLKDGDSTYVTFDEDEDEGCVWNIKVGWVGYDETVLWRNVNLCNMTALRLRYDAKKDQTSFIAE